MSSEPLTDVIPLWKRPQDVTGIGMGIGLISEAHAAPTVTVPRRSRSSHSGIRSPVAAWYRSLSAGQDRRTR